MTSTFGWVNNRAESRDPVVAKGTDMFLVMLSLCTVWAGHSSAFLLLYRFFAFQRYRMKALRNCTQMEL
ncbi:hypothetical protein [Paraburkholderia sp. UCT70]|uniref:hypothetical protein n=1 Tax=Paraburkholderia sp. UCT70 TaxID=2991068 RepID=UPI003D220178